MLLRSNLARQNELALKFLDTRQRRVIADAGLREQHHFFTSLVQPRTTAGYREFVEQSQDIQTDVPNIERPILPLNILNLFRFSPARQLPSAV
ncbi:hypothetical protein, partial [Desulfofustis glycolicus]